MCYFELMVAELEATDLRLAAVRCYQSYTVAVAGLELIVDHSLDIGIGHDMSVNRHRILLSRLRWKLCCMSLIHWQYINAILGVWIQVIADRSPNIRCRVVWTFDR
jgi:hypothetical protein